MEKKSKGTAKKIKGNLKAKIFLYTLGISAAGGAAYLAFDYIKKKKLQAQQLPESSSGTIVINNNLPASNYSVSSVQSKSSSLKDNFPLKRGSSGARVTMLQQALAKVIGISAMNANGGIDGIFGPGTAKALATAGYTDVVDEATFNTLMARAGMTSGSLQVSFDSKSLATTLYRAAESRNIGVVLASLRQIKSPSEYSQVNEYYKDIPIISKTIVTDLLGYAFKTDEQAKEQIKVELLRMGLKVNEQGQWSLQGLGLFNDLITLRDTVVTDSRNNVIPVTKNTILGDLLKVANGMTWFRSVDNSILKVPTQDVKQT